MMKPLENVGESFTDQPKQSPSATTLASGALRELLTWVWSTPLHKTNDVHAAFVKFLAMSATIRPELFDGQTYKQLGARVGISRATISKNGVRFTRRFGIHFRRQYNATDAMRAAALASHKRRKNK